MELTMRQAMHGEYEAVRAFYYALIDQMAGQPYGPKWQKGIYPEDEYMERSTRAGEMYLALSGEQIVGAMVLSHHTSDGYESVRWPTKAGPDEVLVIHTLGVLPSCFRQGVGRFLVEKAIGVAREMRQKAIRLDVLAGNLPAERLYLATGFRFIQRVKLFYEDTGWCDFDLYEYRLEE